MMPNPRPPIYTATVDWLGWTLDRTASFPKCHRFTFGERLDGMTLDCLELVIEAIYSPSDRKSAPLRRLNLNLEKLRALWRLVCDRRWISQPQLLFVNRQLDEVGRMAGGWLKQTDRRTAASQPPAPPATGAVAAQSRP